MSDFLILVLMSAIIILLSGKNLPHKILDIFLYNDEVSVEEQNTDVGVENNLTKEKDNLNDINKGKKRGLKPTSDISDKEDLIEISELEDFDDDEIRIDSDSLIEEILGNG